MKYKVGDKVRVINNSNGNQFKIGEIVTITQLYENPIESHYKANSNNDSWWVNDNNIEPFNYKDMTKCIVLGENTNKSLNPKIIEVFFSLGANFKLIEESNRQRASNFDYIELICKSYNTVDKNSYDLMFGYNIPNDRSTGVLLVGYWNDGIV